jgi:hypothetical protein
VLRADNSVLVDVLQRVGRHRLRRSSSTTRLSNQLVALHAFSNSDRHHVVPRHNYAGGRSIPAHVSLLRRSGIFCILLKGG